MTKYNVCSGACKGGNALVEIAKAFIGSLTAPVPGVDLLDDDGKFEDAEHLVPGDACNVTTCEFRVAFDELIAAAPLAQRTHARSVGPPPVAESQAEIGERITDGCHLPVEYG